jgi:hypothetical protein
MSENVLYSGDHSYLLSHIAELKKQLYLLTNVQYVIKVMNFSVFL